MIGTTAESTQQAARYSNPTLTLLATPVSVIVPIGTRSNRRAHLHVLGRRSSCWSGHVLVNTFGQRHQAG